MTGVNDSLIQQLWQHNFSMGWGNKHILLYYGYLRDMGSILSVTCSLFVSILWVFISMFSKSPIYPKLNLGREGHILDLDSPLNFWWKAELVKHSNSGFLIASLNTLIQNYIDSCVSTWLVVTALCKTWFTLKTGSVTGEWKATYTTLAQDVYK